MGLRAWTYTNANNETLTVGGSSTAYLLESIEGLGTPNTEIQEQKAPFQDGTTYIDALFAPREITTTIAILAPNQFNDIDTARRQLAQRLNPKLGPGVLTYTTESGDQYKINCIPRRSPTFANKQFREPYLRAQIQFYANDPYWLKTTSTTLNFGSFASNTTIGDVAVDGTTSIVRSDGTYHVIYTLQSNGYIYQITSSTGETWSNPSLITGEDSEYLTLIEQSNATLRLVYKKVSNGNTVQKTSTDNGVTWSSESTVTTNSRFFQSLIQQSNGTFRLAMATAATGADIVQITSSDGSTWSGESTIVSGNYCRDCALIQLNDDSFYIAYVRDDSFPPYYIYGKSSADGSTWSAATLINNSISAINLTLIQDSNNIYHIVWNGVTNLYHSASTNGTSWSTPTQVGSGVGFYPSAVQVDGIIKVFFAVETTFLLTMSSNSVFITHNSDIPIPVYITFYGPSTNPKIINNETGEYIKILKTLDSNDYFTIDTTFGQKTVRYFDNGTESNGNAYLDIASTFFKLDPGTTEVYYTDDSGTNTSATLTYTERYVGI